MENSEFEESGDVVVEMADIARLIGVVVQPIDAVSYSGADGTFVTPRPTIGEDSPWWNMPA